MIDVHDIWGRTWSLPYEICIIISNYDCVTPSSRKQITLQMANFHVKNTSRPLRLPDDNATHLVEDFIFVLVSGSHCCTSQAGSMFSDTNINIIGIAE